MQWGAKSKAAQPLELLTVDATVDPPRLDPEARETALKWRLTLSVAQPADGIAVSNTRLVVVLDESVRPGLALKTAPDHKLLGPLSSGAELTIGEVAAGHPHSLLLQMRAPQRRVGVFELGRIELLVDMPSRGLVNHRQELRLVATYGEPQPAPETEAPVQGVQLEDERPDARLADDFLDAYRRGFRDESAGTLQQLLARCVDAGRRRLLQSMLSELDERGKLSKERLDEFSSAGTVDRPEASLFDVVLLEAGERPIKVAREIRAATGLGLRDVTELIKTANATIGRALGFAQAGALQRRVQAVGARAEVRRADDGGPAE